MRQSRPGFILVLTMGLVAVMTILVARMLTELMSFQKLESVLFIRAQAQQLALSGVRIAVAQLLEKKAVPHDTEQQEKKTEQEERFQERLFELQKIMKLMNRWQTIVFTEKADGIDGSCTIYIACEQGKLNPAVLATLGQPQSRQQFSQQEKTVDIVIQEALQQQVNSGSSSSFNAVQGLAALLKERNNEPWDDVTELLEHEAWQGYQHLLFLTPQRTWAFLDFFSVEHGSKVIQPWALSRSFATLAGLTPSGVVPSDEVMKKIGDTVQQGRPAKETWDLVLRALYNKTLSDEWYELFSTKFETDIFSVISYGTYRDIIVKLYAIVQRKHDKGQNDNERDLYVIKKLYWIYD